MPVTLNTILDSFRVAKSGAQAVLTKWGFVVASAGTKDLTLTVSTDKAIGYWDANANVSSKPPRWILHLANNHGVLKTDLAKNAAGNILNGAGVIGSFNNRQGKCPVVMFRVMPAVNLGAGNGFLFPPEWEWILVVAFSEPLPAGTSGETLSGYNSGAGTFDYKGDANPAKVPFPASGLWLVTSKAAGTKNPVTIGGANFTYDDATQSIKSFLHAGTIPVSVCDPSNAADLIAMASTIESALKVAKPAATVASTVSPASNLTGISDEVYDLINASLAVGKRHFVFHGPPGTGKTTLAEHVAEQLSEDGASFVELTASSSWSSQDLIGGYQPLGPGKVGFIPGAMLRDFDKPIIVDEMNRCPIDKVIGPLFSVLAGQASTLPYRVEVTDQDSDFYKILPKPTSSKLASEFAPGPSWSMICTLNQVDKTQLGQVSYALSRRFTWIRVGVPANLREFVVEMLDKHSLLKGTKDLTLPNPVADMWERVNRIRELGGAPIIDFLRLAGKMNPGLDLLSDMAGNNKAQGTLILALGASVLPLLDGIRRMEAEELWAEISAVWKLDDSRKAELRGCLMDLAL